ncbi:MAG: hypothetical protein V4719_26620 [Planctomycetota bacterium]
MLTTIRHEWTTDGSSMLQSQQQVESDGDERQSYTVAGGVTNDDYLFSSLASERVGGLLMVTGGTLTLKTNSTTEPDQTAVITPTSPLIWGSPADDKLVGDITAIYLTNAGADPVTLTIRILKDNVAVS